MSRGVGRLITTAAGWFTVADGRGGRDRCGAAGFTVRSGRRLTCRSTGGVGALDLDLGGAAGVDLDGCQLVRVTGSIPGGADMGDASGGRDAAGTAAMAASRRCALRASQLSDTLTMRALAELCRQWMPADLAPVA